MKISFNIQNFQIKQVYEEVKYSQTKKFKIVK